MPIYSPTGFLDITNATLRTSNTECQNLQIGSGNVYVTTDLTSNLVLNLENITNLGATTSNTVVFSNVTTGLTVSSNIVATGNVTAGSFLGDGSGLTAVPAAQITGTLDAARIPALDTAKITTGTLDAARIPALDTAKITTGTLDAARIPALDTAKITTGTLDAARIPALDTAKITTGTLDAARIPALDTAKITTGTLDAARIPALDTAKITTGTLDAARIPTLNQNTTGSAGSATTAGTCSGNSATATTAATLTTPRAIGGVSFDGSVDITPTTFGAATFSGDVTVDSTTFHVDSTNNRVGIGTSSPAAKLQVVGDIQIPNGSSLTTSTTDTFTHDGSIMPHYGIKWRDHSTTVGTAGPVLQLSAYNGYKFFTQGTERVTVSSTGNVGIGTAAPVGVNGGQRLEGSSTTGFEFIAASSDTTNIPGQFNGAFLIKNMDANAPTPHYAGMAGREGGTAYSGHMDLLFYSGRDNYENNTPQMVIDRYSNVGIGTSSPTQSLHVSKVTSGGVTSLLVSNPNGAINASAALKLGVSAEDNTVAKFGIIHERKSTYGGGDTYFCTNYATDTTEVSESDVAMTILGSNKNVGIGTNTPATALEVNGDIGIGRVAGGYTFREVVGGGVRATIKSNANNDLILSTGGDSEALRILNNGNVGIGKTDPGTALDVVGDIRASANITAYSDRRLKSDIEKIENALDKVCTLGGYTYTMKGQKYTGLIAQEVLEVLPEAVTGSEETNYALAYGNMMGLIVEAIKELKEKSG